MPILGIIASSHVNFIPTGSFSSIATVTVGSGGSSTVSFISIPQTYKHLQLRGIAKGTTSYSSGTDTAYLNFNKIGRAHV